MKIALINDKLDAGGAEKVIVNMANLLWDKGVDVKVILLLAPTALDNLLRPAIPVTYLHRKGRFDIKAMKQLKALLQDVDIAHVHSRYNYRYYIVTKWVMGITKPKIVFHEHIPVLKVDVFTKIILKQADAYVAVLQSMCNWAKEVIRLHATRVFYLPNTINPPKRIIPQQNAGYKLIMVGNIWHFKNQLFAVDVINNLPPEYTLDIYGVINSQSYYDQLIAKIEASNLQKRITIIQGVTDIYSVVGKYNLAIHTSEKETGPLVLLEYMYASLPFITYKTGDVVSVVHKHLNDAIVENFDITTWVKAIQLLAESNELRTQVRQKMKTIIRQQYSEESYYNELKGIYSLLLN